MSLAPQEVAALRAVTAEPRRGSPIRTHIGLGCAAAGVAALVAGAALSSALPLLAAALLVPGLILAGPAVIRTLSGRLRPLLVRVAGVEGGLAAINIARNSRRSASTTLGLTFSVAFVGFFVILAATFAAGLGSSLAPRISADLVVVGSDLEPGGSFDPNLAGQIRGVPGVYSAVGYSVAEGAVNATSTLIAGIDSGAGAVYDFDVVAGTLDAVAGNGVAAIAAGSADNAGDHRLGETILIELVDGTLEAEVVAVFEQSLPGFDSPSYLISTETLATLRQGLLTDAIFVTIGGEQLSAPTYPVPALAMLALGAVVAGTASAALPVWRATRIPTVDALARQ